MSRAYSAMYSVSDLTKMLQSVYIYKYNRGVENREHIQRSLLEHLLV
jgi:hypothetical protein